MCSLSFWIHVSGPIAVVVAGLLIGNPGRHGAVAAQISSAGSLARVHVRRGRLFDPGAGPHRAAGARVLRGRRNGQALSVTLAACAGAPVRRRPWFSDDASLARDCVGPAPGIGQRAAQDVRRNHGETARRVLHSQRGRPSYLDHGALRALSTASMGLASAALEMRWLGRNGGRGGH